MKSLIISLVITTLAILLIPQITVSQCHIDDWTALKALYESTDGDNWKNSDGWDIMIASQSTPPTNCNLEDLFGIYFYSSDRIETLILNNNGLNGTIPVELSYLTNLNKLVLVNNNKLTGIIPAELGVLTNLSVLSLRGNKLTGTIPAELSNLTNLGILYLSNNQLTGTIPTELGKLTNLYLLLLSGNQLSGCYPNSFLPFCDLFLYIGSEQISYGNNFDASWDDFCNKEGEGACTPVLTSSYYLPNELDFIYDYSSQILNIASSNLPIKNIAIYNTNGQMLKNYNINTSSSEHIDVSYLTKGLYVAVASIGNKLFQAKFIITQ